MVGIDWRTLYAENQAAIAAAGIRPQATILAVPPAALVSERITTSAGHAPTNPRGGRALHNPHRHRPATAYAPRLHVDERVLVHVPPDLDPSVPVAAVCMLHGCPQ